MEQSGKAASTLTALAIALAPNAVDAGKGSDDLKGLCDRPGYECNGPYEAPSLDGFVNFSTREGKNCTDSDGRPVLRAGFYNRGTQEVVIQWKTQGGQVYANTIGEVQGKKPVYFHGIADYDNDGVFDMKIDAKKPMICPDGLQ